MPVQKSSAASHPSPAPRPPPSSGHLKTPMQAYARPLSRAAVLSRLVGRIVEQVKSLRDRLVQMLPPRRQDVVPTAQDFERVKPQPAGSGGATRVHPQSRASAAGAAQASGSDDANSSAAYEVQASELIQAELLQMEGDRQKLVPLSLPDKPAQGAFAEQMWKDCNRSKYSVRNGDQRADLYQIGDPAGFGRTTVAIAEQERARDAILAFAAVASDGNLDRLNQIAKYAQQGLAGGLMRACMLPGAPLTLNGQRVMPITLSGATEFLITQEPDDTHLVRLTLSPTAETLMVSRIADGQMLALPPGSTIKAEITIRVKIDGAAEMVGLPSMSMVVGPGKVMTLDEYSAQAKSTVIKVK